MRFSDDNIRFMLHGRLNKFNTLMANLLLLQLNLVKPFNEEKGFGPCTHNFAEMQVKAICLCIVVTQQLRSLHNIVT